MKMIAFLSITLSFSVFANEKICDSRFSSQILSSDRVKCVLNGLPTDKETIADCDDQTVSKGIIGYRMKNSSSEVNFNFECPEGFTRHVMNDSSNDYACRIMDLDLKGFSKSNVKGTCNKLIKYGTLTYDIVL